MDNETLGILGVSSYVIELRKRIRWLAPGDFPVLITGNSGTGKELIAKAIHYCSTRKTHEMVTINCAALPEHLQESEFFGHTKGSFTGAFENKEGFIKLADNSTLFLDEIGEISLQTQAKLLRVLDSGEYNPIGKTTPEKANIRILSATNKNLEDLVTKGIFRDDLFYRLKGMVIKSLPLSVHKEDIPILIENILKKYDKKIDQEALNLLINYKWQGNVRELKYTIEVICVAALHNSVINAEIVNSVLNINEPVTQYYKTYSIEKERIIKEFDTMYFTQILQRNRGNVSKAAKEAGMYRPNLLKKIKSLEINIKNFRK